MFDDFRLELTGPEFEPLSTALQMTMTPAEFDRMLKQRLNIDRARITMAGSYEGIVFDVIDRANREGRVKDLLWAARQERPRVALFVDYAAKLGVGPNDIARLEAIIEKENFFQDIAVFRSFLGEVEGQVCRVDRSGEGHGTGFLVGPDLVLTNYHVVQSAIKGVHPLSDFTCRFDFKVRPDRQTNEGMVVKIAGNKPVKSRPYDPADFNEGGATPDPANLDYALLRLAEDVGNKPIGNARVEEGANPLDYRRGWVAVPSEPPTFPIDSPLFIAQHPDTKPMKLALETKSIIRVNNNGTRVRHRTNTEPGSSGSPCFSQRLQLVALHHSGDPNWTPKWNEGIPIHLIRAEIEEYLPKA